jgi:NADH:ubiquinone oxidoreductase subunit F (NADH-binding)/NADH:ubiquinone oxidoreductase subunit E
LRKEEKYTASHNCNCSRESIDTGSVVESVLTRTGREKDKVILVLQEVQAILGYLPSEALKQICSNSEITPGQISGVSTFYSQFRHIPAGKHIIKICSGTACHVKGAPLIAEAFKRVLKITDGRATSEDDLFSIEEVACLGCCTLAPVVQIDAKTYGHVKPTQVDEIIRNFLSTKGNDSKTDKDDSDRKLDAEIRIGLGSCCVAGGSRDILSKLIDVKEGYDLNIKLKPVGCVGVCNQTPLLEVVTSDEKHFRYTNVRKDQVEGILLKHITPRRLNKKLKHSINIFADTFVTDELLNNPVNIPDDQREKFLDRFLSRQVHLATVNSGIISPDSFEEYAMLGGFQALRKALASADPLEIITIISESGLRGRGGAGFPTGVKWRISRNAQGDQKYVVCNGDEGDPGAFMDRMILESYPFRVIEGMMIAGFASGAAEGIFYIRAEYPLAVSRVRKAVGICYEKGLLGKNIEGSRFSFDIRIFEGAGAFVCGEETALIASLEGKRGTPHVRPPYPAVQGFRGKPTLVNNVETLALVPWIINNGAQAFSSIGTEKSKGTKVFALAGKISKGGLIEVPMGITIREIVDDIGGGVGEGRKFKAVQIGGPSGGCIPESLAETPIDYEELKRMGAMMGSGGMVVLDDTDCMVDMAKYFLTFTHKQSCGKCTFCRVGTKHMLNIITRLSEGKAAMSEIDELEKLCRSVQEGSLCGLGKTAPNPVLTGIRYFREEYEAHAKGICPAKKCQPLIKYSINDKCTGCTKCAQDCPVNAIPFTPYEKHLILQEKCTKCDNCRVTCQFDAVEIIDANGQS